MLSQHPAHRLQRPSPAIVSQLAVWRLPRWMLWALCVVYSVAGLWGREPWRSQDLMSMAWMQAIAEGRSGWWRIASEGLRADGFTWLPYWLGALSMKLMPSFIAPEWAARLPFVLLLLLSFAAVWYATYALAREPAAQPLPFALGGEAKPKDYARTVADGSVLALMATLGLAQLGHETTPDAARLAFVALWFYAVAVQRLAPRKSLLLGLMAAVGLAFSGAPGLLFVLALLHLLLPTWLCYKGTKDWPCLQRDQGLPLVAAAMALSLLSVLLQIVLGGWEGMQAAWLASFDGHKSASSLLRLLAWFTWPTGVLAVLALWAWRAWWRSPHILLPAALSAVLLLPVLWSSSPDRSLLLALPVLASLAAMFLPTMQRTVSAWIDWFTLIFFTVCGLVIWVIWLSLSTGWPAKPAQNAAKLLPSLEFSWSYGALLLAVVASVLWVLLIAWRVGRDRSALWKSLALPAGGAAMCWVLLMSLWLPMLDEGRSAQAWVQPLRVAHDAATTAAAPQEPASPVPHCVWLHDLGAEQWAALHWYRPFAAAPMLPWRAQSKRECDWLLMKADAAGRLPEMVGEQRWDLQVQAQGYAHRSDVLQLYRRQRH